MNEIYVQPRRLSPWLDGCIQGFLYGCVFTATLLLIVLRFFL